MSEGFNKFKRKIRAEALIKSLLLSLSAGFVFPTVMLGAAKLFALDYGELTIVWYLLSGLLPFFAVGCITYLILRPTDKKVARRLDTSLNFSERTKTMVEFKDEKGEMIEIQRMDTDRRLQEMAKGTLKMRRLILFILLTAVTAAMFVTALVLPSFAEEEQDVPADDEQVLVDDSEIQWRLERLRELIYEVENELLMMESLRAPIVAELQDLVSVVEQTKVEEELTLAAIETIKDIGTLVENINTAVKIGDSFTQSLDNNFVTLGETMRSFSVRACVNALTALKNLAASDTEVAMNLKEEIDAYLNRSGVSSSDLLYSSFVALSAKLSEYAKSESLGDLDAAFASCEEQLENILYEQGDNSRSKDYIVERLEFIFEIDASDLDDDQTEDDGKDNVDNGSDDKEDENDENNAAGGYGSGGVKYGSDDIIYNPDEGTHVQYGEVIDKYYGTVTEKIIDGLLDEETADMLGKYFDFLYKAEEEKDEIENNTSNDNKE